MVFPTVSKHTRRESKHNAVLQICAVAAIAMCLSACGAQDDASAQSSKGASEKSTQNGKANIGSVIGSVSAGQIIFERANCAMCHPGGGNTMDPGHPIKGVDFAKKYSDDLTLESTIRKGFPNVGMPTFSKKVIDDREMKDLIAYVRSLTPSNKIAAPNK